MESIFTVASGLKPRRAMIVTPGFAEYGRALAQSGCEIRRWSLREADGWQLTDAILEALTPDLDCLFLCTPNNPTGLLPERPLLQAIADRCKSLNINLIWMKRLSILFRMRRALFLLLKIIRISGCCVR